MNLPRVLSLLGRHGILLLLAAWLVTISACFRKPSKATRSDIIIITIDTLRADHLGCYGYFRDTSPNIDHFAQEAVFFENVFTTMATTLPAHLSLMTSTYTPTHGIRANVEVWKRPFTGARGITTLAEAMSLLGYETAAFISATPLKPHSGVQVGFETYDFPADSERRAAETNRHLFEWLSKSHPEEFFLWVHFFDPHGPYSPPAPYDKSFKTDTKQREYLESVGIVLAKHPSINAVQNRYDGEIRYTDQAVGNLLDRIRQHGLWESSTIVLTADHGEGLGQHGWIDHGRIYNEQLHIPLMIKFASWVGQRPQRLARIASLVDVFPTLVEELDIPVPAKVRSQFQGINLMRLDVDRPFVFAERVHRNRNWESGLKSALVSHDWKFFHLTEHPDELYNMWSDRGERHNVIGENPKLAQKMSVELRRIRSWRSGGMAVDALGHSDRQQQTLEELRSLGYVDQ